MPVRVGIPALPRVRIFYGWWVVLACSSLVFYSAGSFFFAFSAFFNPIKDELGLSATAVAIAFSMRSLEGGLEGIVAGYLVDRIGPRPMMLGGAFVSGLGMILLGQVNSLWTFYAAFLFTSLGIGALAGVVGMATVSNWFIRKRSRALGLYSAGAGAGGILVPGMIWLIESYSWRQALAIGGVGWFVVGAVAFLVVRKRPEEQGLLPDGDVAVPRPAGAVETVEPTEESQFTVRQVLSTRAFWIFSIAMTILAIAPQALTALQVPYLESINISKTLAGFVVSGMAVISIVGRVGFGYLGDFKDKRAVFVAIFLLQTLGLVILASVRAPWMLLLYLAVYAPAYGGAIPLRPALLADYYGRNAIGAVQGAMFGVMTVGGIAAPVFAAWIFDIVGSYRPAFYAMAGLTVLAMPLLFFVRRPAQPAAQ